MKKLKFIVDLNSKLPSFLIVKEWVDVLSYTLRIRIHKINKVESFIVRRINQFHLNTFVNFFLNPNSLSLKFIMLAESNKTFDVNKSTIPVIIDFWLNDSQLESFYNAYKCAPLVLISSKEVYEFLKQRNCPLNIEHWGLSIPDSLIQQNKVYEKDIQFCFIGRPNPYFKNFLEKYCEKNPNFVYVYNQGEINKRIYVDNHGNEIMKDSGRESYFEMMRRSKITCYSTPGIDESKKETARFNQVTPRVLEMLSSGCYVIGRYKENPDTDFYSLSKIIPNIETYEEFESCLKNFLALENRDINECANYLEKHKTSIRALELKNILNKYDIEIDSYG